MEQILDTSDIIKEQMKQRFGCTWAQYKVLRAMVAAGKPATCGDLSLRTQRANSTMTALLDSMVRCGFIHRTHGVEDRRTVLTEPTDHGFRVYHDITTYLGTRTPDEVTDYLESVTRLVTATL